MGVPLKKGKETNKKAVSKNRLQITYRKSAKMVGLFLKNNAKRNFKNKKLTSSTKRKQKIGKSKKNCKQTVS